MWVFHPDGLYQLGGEGEKGRVFLAEYFINGVNAR